MIEIIPNWHPIFVHFTVSLLGLAVLFFLLSWLFSEYRWSTQWRHTAFWMLWTGVAVSVFTVIAGWFAYNSVTHDTPSHAAMTEHRNWAVGTFVAYLVIGLWSLLIYRGKQKLNVVFFATALFATGLLITTAWHGGELVYRYGLGVMSLPQSEGEGHDHSHGSNQEHAHDTMDTPTTMPHETDSDGQPHTDSHHDESTAPERNESSVISETGAQLKPQDTQHHHDDGHVHEH
jgi:uncharacterized membrane protein